MLHLPVPDDDELGRLAYEGHRAGGLDYRRTWHELDDDERRRFSASGRAVALATIETVRAHMATIRS